MPIIELENVSKYFGNVRAVESVTARIDKGITLLLGPNGAGKSTLLRCIDGLYKPTKGEVRVFGRDPYENEDLKQKISLLSDNYSLYDSLSVKENLIFFGKLFGLNKEEIEKRAKGILKEIGAEEYWDVKVERLSRGTKQKIAFCRSLLNNPEILLLDEPTAFLDADASEKVRGIVRELAKREACIIYVTQKVEELSKFSSRILIIKKGKILKDSKSEDIYSSFLSNSYISIKFANPVEKRMLENFGEIKVDSDPALEAEFFIRDYKEVGKIVKGLYEAGAYVIGIDYTGPFIERLFESG
ncbi:MAG: ABC transporter ATP-binding protein [Candidatus Micrarchaeaceae archaeon]